ncbi:MAG: hypothetical protein GY711_24985 [bacterium]|nr:hypothetical protein [bacterium]
MNAHRSILLAASLSLAACAGSPFQNATRDASVPNAKLAVHVVEASGGG